MKNRFKKLKIALMAGAVALAGAGMAVVPVSAAKIKGCETSILPNNWCEDDGIKEMIKFIVNAMTAGIAVVGTIGIIICGVTWMTARDNEAQVTKARQRLVNIVIGMALLILLDFVVNMLLGSSYEEIMGVIL